MTKCPAFEEVRRTIIVNDKIIGQEIIIKGEAVYLIKIGVLTHIAKISFANGIIN